MKKVFSGLLALAMAASITGCNSGGASGEPKDLADVKIGVIQLMQHDALDASYEGFKDELVEAGVKEENIDYISVILWGYVLIWYACGDGMFIVQTPRSEASCECET